MGTTQRIIPGVTGEPNWGGLSNALTALANTVEKELLVIDQAKGAREKEQLAPTPDNQNAVSALERQQIKLSNRSQRHYNSAFRHLIATGGGGTKVSKGKSPSLGKAGLRNASRISGFILDVSSSGLSKALNKIGFGSLTGKTVKEVVDFLLVYFADINAGMDDVAANMASCQVMEMLSKDVKTVEELEEKLKTLFDISELTEVICMFYGIYLFEHLSQRFEERITQLKGEAVSRETFKMIKEDIIAQVTDKSKERSLSDIDWKGTEGNAIQEKIFSSIIKIFE
jgi:hypothetical protein